MSFQFITVGSGPAGHGVAPSCASSEQVHRFAVHLLVNPLFVLVALQDCDFDPLKYNSVIECEKPNNDLNRFRGYM